jgi:hypothetical protein
MYLVLKFCKSITLKPCFRIRWSFMFRQLLHVGDVQLAQRAPQWETLFRATWFLVFMTWVNSWMNRYRYEVVKYIRISLFFKTCLSLSLSLSIYIYIYIYIYYLFTFIWADRPTSLFCHFIILIASVTIIWMMANNTTFGTELVTLRLLARSSHMQVGMHSEMNWMGKPHSF